MLDEEIVNVEAAQLVYDLRKKAGLSQRELAKKVGTTASVICRMEQANYESSLPLHAPDCRCIKPEIRTSRGADTAYPENHEAG